MLTLIIILLLALGFYQGWRRGLAMQALRLIGYILSFVVAGRLGPTLAQYLEILVPFPSVQVDSQLAIYSEQASFYLDEAFYNALAFGLIAIIGWILTNFLSMFFTRIMYYQFFQWADNIGGGIINFLITYVAIFLVLFVLSLIPIEFIQQMFVDNPLAYRIVSQTPILSNYIGEVWFTLNPF